MDWPVADEALIDEDLSFRMAIARQVVNLGRAARNAAQIKTRQPVDEGRGGLPGARARRRGELWPPWWPRN